MNNSAMVKIVELSAENFKKYLELNQSYMTKLPEVRDISSFVELQRDYGQSLWEGVQADLKARGEIVRDTVEQTGSHGSQYLRRQPGRRSSQQGRRSRRCVRQSASSSRCRDPVRGPSGVTSEGPNGSSTTA